MSKKALTLKIIEKTLRRKGIPFKAKGKEISVTQAGADKSSLILFIDFFSRGKFKCGVIGETMLRTSNPIKAIKTFESYWDKEKSATLVAA